jgi:branched-chain amino acid transport system ATP-binding protein
MHDALLAIRDLRAWYGPSQALHGIDIDVHSGEVVTLLGRNGAGKSTVLKSIMGIVPRRSGSIRLAGREIAGLAPHEIGRAGVAYCPDDRGIYASLTVRENLLLPPVVAPGGIAEDKLMALFRIWPRAARPLARNCLAASSRCSPSRASCAPVRGCCCSTSPRKGWHRCL